MREVKRAPTAPSDGRVKNIARSRPTCYSHGSDRAHVTWCCVSILHWRWQHWQSPALPPGSAHHHFPLAPLFGPDPLSLPFASSSLPHCLRTSCLPAKNSMSPVVAQPLAVSRVGKNQKKTLMVCADQKISRLRLSPGFGRVRGMWLWSSLVVLGRSRLTNMAGFAVAETKWHHTIPHYARGQQIRGCK
ncbi:LADA_0F05402g1_1 [Lachancea dasiensis]|uniref:LADA_0F05402g1_1 n=1 Tax=Lachancea dasiensis TaxID=1072105 RepID=A0A1G4JJY3_9SACH|nr:LADA_0F05402g1_1 [Lachancea dasiensis]